MKKLLVICGPTATGKTSTALHLAKEFDAELVSADSRQVYRGMDIGTGKDLPVNSKLKTQNSKLGKKGIGFYEVDGVRIWGYDLVEPNEEFSVAQYIKIAGKILRDIWSRGKLPVLVGGTGLYIKGVVGGIATVSVPRNLDLRKSLEGKKVDELFEMLAVNDPIKAASMNVSDRKNSRRLVRAIEIVLQKSKGITDQEIVKNQKSKLIKKHDVLFVGLKAQKDVLNKRIEKRVIQRIKQGVEEEIRKLLEEDLGWESQAMGAIGYGQWKDYFKGQKSLNKVMEDWIRIERQYAKRQMTWFKKDERINWFDISRKNWKKSVEKLVRKWHN